MLEKTIKKVVKKKMDDWIKSIDNLDVQQMVKNNTIVTGGSLVSLMLNEEPKDYDVYFMNKETALAVARYYVNKFTASHGGRKVAELGELEDGRIDIFISSSGVAGEMKDVEDATEFGDDPVDTINESEPDVDKPKYRPVFLSSNAITLSDKVQIIIRFYGTPEEVHDTFDFLHTRGLYYVKDGTLDIKKEVYEAVMNKNLIYTGSRYPVCSIVRMRKFIKRGWNINAGQILKMCMQISDLDLHNVEVLKDQLTGVDSLFFTWLIEALERKQETGDTISTNYVVELIDKMF